MARYILRRVGISIITLLLIVLLLFLLERLMPGTPFNDEKLKPEQIEVLYAKYGLDKPMWQQILIYIGNIFRGDFGLSYTIQKNLPISSMLAAKFPVSIRIGSMGFVVGVLMGFILGTFAALKHNTPLDTAASVFSMIGGSVPSYVMGMLHTECQDHCRGEKRQHGCDGEDPRLFPSETGKKSNIDDVRLLWNAPRIYQPRSSGAAGKKGDLGNHGVQHEAAQQEIRDEPAGLSCPGSISVDSPHIGL